MFQLDNEKPTEAPTTTSAPETTKAPGGDGAASLTASITSIVALLYVIKQILL